MRYGKNDITPKSQKKYVMCRVCGKKRKKLYEKDLCAYCFGKRHKHFVTKCKKCGYYKFREKDPKVIINCKKMGFGMNFKDDKLLVLIFRSCEKCIGCGSA